MDFWSKTIKALVDILENPNSKKAYQTLKKYYDQAEKKYESDAIQRLIEKRFNNDADDIDSDKK